MNTKTTIIISLGIIILFGGLIWFSKKGDSGVSATTSIVATDWVRGAKDSKIEIIEYGDFQCPACGAFEPMLMKVQEDFKDSLKFSYRHFPLVQAHPNALITAKASEAAGAQGKFWEMHDMLYQNQAEWSGSAKAYDILVGYATKLGLDVEKFKTDINSGSIEAEIKSDYSGGINLSVDATPTFFVNGKKIVNPRSYEDFKKMVEDTINASSQ